MDSRIPYLTTNTVPGEYNETANHNETILRELNHQSVRQHAPVIGYLILLMVIGIPGNSVTCYIYKKKMKKTTTNRFILWLAILDLATCVLAIPFEICAIFLEYLFDQPAICKIFRFILFVAFFTSSITVLSIAADRYYKICKPLTQPPTRKYRYFIVGSAIIGSIVSIPVFFLYGTAEKETSHPGIVGHSCRTVQTFQNSASTLAYFVYFLACNVFDMVLLSVLYTCVGLQIWKLSRSKTEEERSSNATDKNKKNMNKAHKGTATCVAITIVFAIAFLPTLILHIVFAIQKGFKAELSGASYVAFTLFMNSIYLTNVLNPVLYGFINPVFRRECVSILKPRDLFGMCRSAPNTSVCTLCNRTVDLNNG